MSFSRTKMNNKDKTTNQGFTHTPKSLVSGFTLIEIMVAVSIFAMVMVVAVGAVLSIVAANKKAQALNSVITNLNFALEGMMRDLRTGYDYDCGVPTPELDDCTGGTNDPAGQAIKFTSSQSDGQKVTYFKSGNAISKLVDVGTPYSLTAPEVTVDRLDFYVTGTASGAADSRQPKILVVISGKYIGFGQVASFSLQTLVSQRKLDI